LRASRTRIRRALLVVGAVSLLAAGLGYAAIPGANGVISGCYDSKTGALRVLDREGGASCDSKEASLEWNRTGPQGPQGQSGPQGSPGTAEAYARIGWNAATSSVVVSHARGITAANVTRAAPGIYCIEGLSFQPNVAVGSGLAAIRTTGQNPDGTFTFAPTGQDTTVTTQTTQEGAAYLVFCDDSLSPPNPTVRIYVVDGGGNFVDRQFTILLDD
jgi:hypothetical protein